MFRALLGLRCAVVYFAVAGYGDSRTEFEVEDEVNPSFIFVDALDVALGISLTMVSNTIFISMDSLKESVQETFCQS